MFSLLLVSREERNRLYWDDMGICYSLILYEPPLIKFYATLEKALVALMLKWRRPEFKTLTLNRVGMGHSQGRLHAEVLTV